MSQKDTISAALSSIAHALEGFPGGGGGGTPAAASGLFQLAAAEGPYEQVIVCRSLGTATVTIHQKDLFIVPNGKLNGLDGSELGFYTGVFNAKTTDNLFQFPDAPQEP